MPNVILTGGRERRHTVKQIVRSFLSYRFPPIEKWNGIPKNTTRRITIMQDTAEKAKDRQLRFNGGVLRNVSQFAANGTKG